MDITTGLIIFFIVDTIVVAFILYYVFTKVRKKPYDKPQKETIEGHGSRS